ncbi:MAG: WbqC family protein [Saprospiraceae bacterium]
MNQNRILLALHYLPNIQYCSKLMHYSELRLESAENYRKGSYRNRCYIASPNGLMRLSIPLKKGKNERQSIREVRIAYDLPWQQQHWRGIRAAYGNAPFFDHYAPEFAAFYEKKYEFLFDFNWDILQKIAALIGLEAELLHQEVFLKETPTDMLDGRSFLQPKAKLKTPDPHFKTPKYGQVFEEKTGFLANLSVLDLLFCTGPQSPLILENAFQK